jgi:hypothetical protein
MATVLKVLAAFCVGIGAMVGLQTLWLSSIKQQLNTTHVSLPQVSMQRQVQPVAPIDMSKFRSALYPKLDPNLGKDAWPGTLNRQVSESINAGRLVPLPPRTNFPGVPRH